MASFNDVFVVVACALLLFATASIIGTRTSPVVAGLASALVAWGLAEVFVRRRRMALPAIVLTCSFVASIYLAGFNNTWPWMALVMAMVAVPATWWHWKRFHVPITSAALGLLLVLTAAGAVGPADTASFIAAFGNEPMLKPDWSNPAWRTWQEARHDWFPAYRHAAVFVGGLILFGLAMRWDTRDVDRRRDLAGDRPSRASRISPWLRAVRTDLGLSTVWRREHIVRRECAAFGAGAGGLVDLLVTRPRRFDAMDAAIRASPHTAITCRLTMAFSTSTH